MILWSGKEPAVHSTSRSSIIAYGLPFSDARRPDNDEIYWTLVVAANAFRLIDGGSCHGEFQSVSAYLRATRRTIFRLNDFLVPNPSSFAAFFVTSWMCVIMAAKIAEIFETSNVCLVC